MLQLTKKLDNQTGQNFSYASEQLARIKIEVAIDGTVTVSLLNEEEKNEIYLLVASLSSGLQVKE